MLTTDTKRKIDSARDILVGKVPDPKAQVEQITNAMIYKFMDDMDQESVDLGGKPRYFTNGFEKYAWSKLMDPKLGGLDRLELYIEAITHLSQNPHLPQLFRDIFKDAFLPYRDPETLSLFLKQINEFTYHHSEELGNSFEYLLSVLGSQGDAGQFRTPRHIIDFIVSVVDPKKTDRILDPACGTAGFLISAYKYILASHDEKDNATGKATTAETRLTPDERKRLVKSVVGYDISPDMVKLSRVNMYLHGFPEPHISEYDTLSSEDNWDDTFDVILANPPFMTPKGGIRPHKRFSVQASRAEVLFVDYIAEHLTPNGRAGVIVPEGVIFQSDGAYRQLRKMLVENYLYAVVSLPGGVFQPYSGVKTSILFLDQELAKRSENILFVNISNVGTGLGAQRRPIPGNQLQPTISLIEKFKENTNLDVQIIKNTVNKSKSFFTIGVSTVGGLDTIGSPSEVNDLDALVVPKQEIAETKDYNLTGERYRAVVASQGEWPKAKLAELINESSERLGSVEKPVWSVSNTAGFVKAESQFKHRVASEDISKYKLVEEDYFAFNPSRINVGSIAWNTSTEQGAVSPMYVVFKADEKKIDPKYLFVLLKSAVFNNFVKKYAQGAVRQQLRFKDLINIEVPLPSLEKQKEIADEVDGYQKIINAAHTILETYAPTITFDPHWDVVDLEGKVEFVSGLTLSIPDSIDESGTPIISMDSVSEFGQLNLKNVRKVNPANKKMNYCKKGDLLFNWRNGSKRLVGKTAYFDGPENTYTFASFLLGIRPVKDCFDAKFLWYLLNQFRREGKYARLMRENVNGLFNREELKILKVPMPPVDLQIQISRKLDEEQTLLDSTRTIVEVFENKIRDKIAEVWG